MSSTPIAIPPPAASAGDPRADLAPRPGRPAASPLRRFLRRHPTLLAGAVVLAAVATLAAAAPWVATHDPGTLDPLARLKASAPGHLLGTDALGRDLFSRIVWGGRASLIVAIAVATLSTVVGVALGLLAGFVAGADRFVMRVMDGLMAIPEVLLAIALMAVTRTGLLTVVVAITVPQVPRVVRLVRSLSLSLRERQYVEAAHALGTPLPVILWRHVLPNMVTPLIVQATFIAATAMLTEALLSFLGVGLPPQIPSWGTMMADGRNFVAVALHAVWWPGLFLAATVLSVNLIGDGLRDALDPRLARQL